MSDFSSILLRYFNLFSRGLWHDAAEPSRPRVFHVQKRSPFAGRKRHVREATSCAGRLDVLKISAFHRLAYRCTLGEFNNSSVPWAQIWKKAATKTKSDICTTKIGRSKETSVRRRIGTGINANEAEQKRSDQQRKQATKRRGRNQALHDNLKIRHHES